MSESPISHVSIDVPKLGTIKGLEYSNGIRQFCGIPYASISKRWTRSVLKTSLPNDFWDGTKHGPKAPQPPEYTVGLDPMVPVPPFPHFPASPEHEFDCLNLNIALPPKEVQGPLPVMVWIHGGSFLFGSSGHPSYDFVKKITFAIERGTPIIGVSINYRVGLFGFLASESIKNDLAKDGFAGAGNFGLTDQQTALTWVHKHIPSFGGDPDNVTIFGESAGGMSVAHQIWAAQPAPFQRAISMSGTLNTIPVWPLEKHEERFRALLGHFKIDPDASDALEQLRRVPQQDVANATCPIEGVIGATGNPCQDGWYHASPPSLTDIRSPPDWLQAYMTGDVKDEAMIFRYEITEDDYDTLWAVMIKFLDETNAKTILEKYDIMPDCSPEKARLGFEEMASDAIFILQNWLHVQKSRVPQTFAYHMDQVSTLETPLKGLAYHAIDILYIFRNLEDQMSDSQKKLALKMSADFLDFAYGRDPWERFGVAGRSMVYGPNDKWAVKSEEEDEPVRRYGRMKQILGLGESVFPAWMMALDSFANKRWRLGKVTGSDKQV